MSPARRKTSSSAAAVGSRKKAKRRPPVPKQRLAELLGRLAKHDPHPRCALDHANPYELLAATILSAQCTDVRVNLVTPALFARYPAPGDLAAAEQEDVEELVRTTGFFRNKAKNLIGMARGLVERHDSQVPEGMDDLLELPGVARKTANVVRGECFGLADGVVVDTHVNRISKRLGFSREDDPVKVERDLMALIPPEDWIVFSHRIIRLGRTFCPARKPRCEECPLSGPCPRRGV
jgi:endonuclease-3